MRVRSRLCCRMISCPAANGIRWVKPSSAMVLPSWTWAAIASCSDRNVVIGYAPLCNVEEDGFARTLQHDVKAIHDCSAAGALGQQRRPPLDRDTQQHWVVRIGRLVREVEPRQEVVEQAAAKHRNTDMRRLQSFAI